MAQQQAQAPSRDAIVKALKGQGRRSTYRPRTTDVLKMLCQAHGLPLPETEVVFHPARKWRADYLWREPKVILEQEGGTFRGGKGGGSALGAHSSGTGILRDMAKSNAAQLLGYVYLRFTPRQIQSGEVVDALRQALSREQCEPLCPPNRNIADETTLPNKVSVSTDCSGGSKEQGFVDGHRRRGRVV